MRALLIRLCFVALRIGWNDVGFTGNSDLQTPNIDALAYNGRILRRHYSQSLCTPSRTALFTSRYPIRSGMQGLPMLPAEPRALPLYERLMPQYFKDLGYQTHLVGKWHLGYYDWKYTPTLRRAFDSHFGYFSGFIGYFDHEIKTPNLEPAYQLRGRYVTELITEEAVRLIRAAAPSRNNTAPLFLFLSHLAPHAGNPGEHDLEYLPGDLERPRLYSAMVWNLDKSVGQVVQALAENAMLNNSIIVFVSDNGAQTTGIFRNDGTSQQLFHLVDWLPTLFHAAGGNTNELSGMDGQDQWPGLLRAPTEVVEPGEYAARHELLVHIDEAFEQYALIWRNWKLILGTISKGEHDGWQGNFTNINYNYQPKYVSESQVAVSFMTLSNLRQISHEEFLKLQSETRVDCNYIEEEILCKPEESPCLFDLASDPCERVNLSGAKPSLVASLMSKLRTYMSQMKPQMNTADDDAAFHPKFNNTWFPWRGRKDFASCGAVNN
ncbi:hypothetical protein B566_EDAN005165 [Ephemera danica]|nr:hypothetical protein B566_EDAN005165 [Ephemera danica]